MRSILLSFCLFFSLSLQAEEKIPEKPVETSFQVFRHQDQTIFALSYKNFPHWHTYWKNPGDAGLPTKIEPKNFQIKEFAWPIPKRYVEKGDILAYGYDGEYTRFFTIEGKVPERLELESTWLVCKHICIPGKVEITANYNRGVLTPSPANDFIVPENQLQLRFDNLPHKRDWPSDLDLVLKKGEGDLELFAYYNYTNTGAKDLFHNLGMLTPYRVEPLDIMREKLYRSNEGNLFGKIKVAWDGEYMDPPVAFPQDGQFQKPVTLKFLWQDPVSEKVSIIEKTFDRFDLQGGKAIDSLMSSMNFLAPKTNDSPSDSEKKDVVNIQSEPLSQSFLTILFFAFIGGLILNIMPCVLPVISIKLFGLVIHSDESHASIFKHNLFYTLGVLTTFLTLAVAILVLKSTGENIGWGFQLQSPVFVSLMIGVLFVFSLNLFGLYEFQTPGGKTLGNVELKKGFMGDFFGGVLATILSTPCSAPFLGTALTFAFTSSPIEIILTFQAIGLGLAFPFLMTGIFPKTIKFLPKPGLWMESVKKFLGLTLILTMIWLIDVFISLTSGNLPLMKLNTALVLIFFAFYFQKYISKKNHWRALFFVLAALPVFSLYTSPMSFENSGSDSDLLDQKNAQTEILWEKWSEKRMEELKGETVFIDFTAKWCFTCKVNDKLVLQTDSFRNLVRDQNLKLLLGDWTKYDPVIGDFLKKNGLVGVPAYFIQKPDGTLINLGETITIGKIKKNL